MMQKVVLVQLPSPWLIDDRDMPLLGVLHLATNLAAHGIDVQVADLAGQDPEKWLIPEGDIYGVSFVTPQTPMAKRAVEILRARTRRKVTVIAGGPHPSALPEWCLTRLGFDHVFVGEADWALLHFVLRGGGGRIVHCTPPDLSTLPPLRRDFIDIRSFHRIGINQYVMPSKAPDGLECIYEGYIHSGRGCPHRCNFCAQHRLTGGKVRFFSNAHVFAEVDELLNKWDCHLIYFQDDTFNISTKRVKELCAGFRERGMSWHCLCRADLFDDEQAEAMAASGCLNVTFGFESGSDAMLRAMNKGETVADGLRAAELCRKHGLGLRGQIIVGYPGETDSTIAETEAFMREVRVDKWGVHAFVPLPGSASWDICKPEVADDFAEGFQTIGQPGRWDKIFGDEERVRGWLLRLRSVAAERNAEVGVGGPNAA